MSLLPLKNQPLFKVHFPLLIFIIHFKQQRQWWHHLPVGPADCRLGTWTGGETGCYGGGTASLGEGEGVRVTGDSGLRVKSDGVGWGYQSLHGGTKQRNVWPTWHALDQQKSEKRVASMWGPPRTASTAALSTCPPTSLPCKIIRLFFH